MSTDSLFTVTKSLKTKKWIGITHYCKSCTTDFLTL